MRLSEAEYRRLFPRAPRVRREGALATDIVAAQCRVLNLPIPVVEFRFHPQRLWAFDYAWPDLRVALEREGVTYPVRGSKDHRLGGRHVSAKGFREDTVKYAEAFMMGWRVLRCLPEQIEKGQAVEWLEPVLRSATNG